MRTCNFSSNHKRPTSPSPSMRLVAGGAGFVVSFVRMRDIFSAVGSDWRRSKNVGKRLCEKQLGIGIQR
jgi:hypothetical protein